MIERESAAFLKGQRVIVTGGAGFVGGALVRRLVQHGVDPIVVDDLSTGSCGPAYPGSRLSVTDLSRNSLMSILSHSSACFHLACRNIIVSVDEPEIDLSVNGLGTMRLMRVLRDVAPDASVVYTSSASVYGDAAPPFSESSLTQCRTPYSVSKLAGEGYTLLYRPRATVLRLSNVYGPGQRPDSSYAAVATKFVAAALRGDDLLIHGDGSQTRDFTYVEDVVDALLLAAKNQSGRICNIGTGNETTVRTLAETVLRIMADSAHPWQRIRSVSQRPMLDSIRSRSVNPSLAASILGWRPKTSLEDGLRLWKESLCA